ncbi:hypothetical protein GCM10010121_079020 [Streptomyces brasiliensis]|uniref:Uncharacterized protein n=1 Tax=Streptomyces brasiliensis TaxID=1954 RepID=A0A917P2I7_9ACTN|nr:hypothetical protein GCM10010121_079020 [Streptomyces brasiliensis]
MTNATAPRKPSVKMTIRVYRVDRYGLISEDRGTVACTDHGRQALPQVNAYPRCESPRCTPGKAAAR